MTPGTGFEPITHPNWGSDPAHTQNLRCNSTKKVPNCIFFFSFFFVQVGIDLFLTWLFLLFKSPTKLCSGVQSSCQGHTANR